ncbi:MAG TPA: DUF6491 family protein [Rhizomicrobium sp.]
MRRTLLAAAAAASLFVSVPAFAKPEVCIRQNDISNWKALNDREIVFENYQHQKALFELLGPCTGLQFHETLAIRSPGGTQLSCIDTGDEILVRDTGIGQRCVIRSITAYAGDGKARPYKADHPDGGDHSH